ncbi:Aluminum-activated malate transporter [Corchorus olitorius]|uniref:Aluminum-activated malate transporter n=1 Tax=Corchorus olitorius TaxID=93759 RepID=A0A1R3GI01_9ROSI|nr:Aluminum-activated malate transporter [Corchorus olitorius]
MGSTSRAIQASAETRGKIKEACIKLSSESGKALKELASAIQNEDSTTISLPSHCKVQKCCKQS